MASQAEVQYVFDAEGKTVSVIVPIELWREIESERETAYLLKSEAMKNRLLEAKERTDGISLQEAQVQFASLHNAHEAAAVLMRMLEEARSSDSSQ